MAPLYIDGVLQSGFPATVNERRLVYAPIREQVLSILGSTGIIIPMGDSQHEAADRTTVTTVGEEQVVFTYAPGAVTAFATPPALLGPAQIPIVTFNASNEDLDTPDATYFSRGNGTVDSAFSLGMWMYPQSLGGDYLGVFAKDNNTDREWKLDLTTPAVPIVALYLFDDSANVNCSRPLSASLTLSTWAFVVFTYDGGGGATAASGINAYKDGALANGSAANQATYVAMENLTAPPTVGSQGGVATRFYGGKIAGGPLGPIFVQAALSADAIKRIYQLGRTAMGV